MRLLHFLRFCSTQAPRLVRDHVTALPSCSLGGLVLLLPRGRSPASSRVLSPRRRRSPSSDGGRRTASSRSRELTPRRFHSLSPERGHRVRSTAGFQSRTRKSLSTASRPRAGPSGGAPSLVASPGGLPAHLAREFRDRLAELSSLLSRGVGGSSRPAASSAADPPFHGFSLIHLIYTAYKVH